MQQDVPEDTETDSIPKEGIEGLLASCREEIEYIKISRPEIDAMKDLLVQSNEALTSTNGQYQETLTEIKSLQKEVHSKANRLKQAAEALDENIKTVSEQCQEIDRLHGFANDNATSASECLSSMNTLKTNAEGLGTDIEELKRQGQESVVQSQSGAKEISDIAEDGRKLFEGLEEIHRQACLGERDDAGNIIEASYKDDFLKIKEQGASEVSNLQSLQMQIVEENKELRDTLEKKILDLLPSAGAAGLAGSFHDAKQRYCKIAATIFYYAIFIAPLLCISFMYYQLLIAGHSDITDTTVLASKLLITVPLGLISWFGLSSIRLNRRLYEEYNHKQRVMELYLSFKKEIDLHGSDDQRQNLLTIMLGAVEDKPSLAMNRYDKGIEEITPLATLMSITKKKDDKGIQE